MSNLADKLEVATTAQAEGNDPGAALTIYQMIQRQQEMVAKALPAGMDAGRFVRMVLTEVRRTPKLAMCDPATLMGAMMLSAQTGLEPGGPLGQAFLIPRWNKHTLPGGAVPDRLPRACPTGRPVRCVGRGPHGARR